MVIDNATDADAADNDFDSIDIDDVADDLNDDEFDNKRDDETDDEEDDV